MIKNVNSRKSWKCKKHENDKCAKVIKCKTRVKILRLHRGGLISALKPGPVVPPGTQKVPNQAARKTQSVDFAHLSDILAFLRGGHFLTLFLSYFCVFDFVTFLLFHDFDFVTFYTFLIFSILTLFHFLLIFMIYCFFTVFHCFLISQRVS